MLNPFLSTEQQGIVLFWIWQPLDYWKRLLLSFGCILLGFALQLALPFLWYVGVPFLLAGTLLLTVRGYDNRVKMGKYSPEDAWEQVKPEKIQEIGAFVKKMRKWDRSALDASNRLGKFLLVPLVFILGVTYAASTSLVGKALAVDAAILLLPHWLTGKREIMSQPKLQLKIKVLDKLLGHRDITERLQQLTIDYFLLLKGQQAKVPEDIKFRVGFPDQDPKFLGCYGQIVTNSVKGKAYPYFYVVMVAEKRYGLKQAYNKYLPSKKLIKEYKQEGDVEVLVIRQQTTRTSGYHTNHRTMRRILLEGLRVAEEAAVT